MAGVMTNDLGRITISDSVIEMIAGYAAIENFGIVGMVTKTASDGFWELLKKENLRKGVKVAVADEQVTVDLYVMVEYGVSINAVALNAIENVTYRIHEFTNLTVMAVNVHVESVRV